MQSCRRCGRDGVADPEAAGWGDGGSLCPDCRAERNRRARASATRIAAIASLEAARLKGWRRLATIRTLPGMDVLRSIVFDGDGLAEQLPEVWRELGPGTYLLTVGGDGRAVENFAVDVDEDIEVTPVTTDEARRLPEVVAALLTAG